MYKCFPRYFGAIVRLVNYRKWAGALSCLGVGVARIRFAGAERLGDKIRLMLIRSFGSIRCIDLILLQYWSLLIPFL